MVRWSISVRFRVLGWRCSASPRAMVPELLSSGEVLDVVEGTESIVRWALGLRSRMLAEFADRHPAGTSAAPPGADASGVAPVERWVPDEVGLTLGISRLEALGEIALAQRLTHVLPDTLAALEAGRIDRGRAELIARATAVLPVDKARAVEAAVLAKAPGATRKQLGDRVRRAIARVDPDGEYRRHREANTERRVSIRSLEDGMASLWFYGSAPEIEAAWQMADRLARALGPEDPRTLDQRRFDLAMQVLQGRLTVTDLSDVDAAVSSVLAAAGQNADDRDSDDRSASGSADAGARATDGSVGCAGSGSGTRPADPDTEARTNARGGAPDDGGAADGGGAHAAAGTPSGEAGSDPCAAAGADRGAPTSTDTGAPTDGVGTAAVGTSAHRGPPDGGESSGGGGPVPPGGHVPPDVLAEAVAQALAQRADLHATVHKPLIQVVVGLDTLLGDDHPAELLGHGPINATTARALAAGGTLGRLVTDPLSGTLLEHGRATYAPPAGLADHVRARDQICRGPHCTRRIRDLDHHHPWAHGGRTDDANLHGYCQHHHQLKDAPGWQVIAHPDRSLTWISPHGRRHTTEPYDYRAFTDHPAPERTWTDSDGPAGMDDGPPPF